jgi:hypothetical protein
MVRSPSYQNTHKWSERKALVKAIGQSVRRLGLRHFVEVARRRKGCAAPDVVAALRGALQNAIEIEVSNIPGGNS